MKLYEINQQIEELMALFDVDEETGEVAENLDNEEIMARLADLNMERQAVLEYLAKMVLNLRSEAAAVKAEEQRLRSRRIALERKEDRIMKILDRECNGQKTSLGVATVSYRKTSRVDVFDAAAAIQWLEENEHLECLRISAPEIAKTETKKLLNSGVNVPGVEILEDMSCSLR